MLSADEAFNLLGGSLCELLFRSLPFGAYALLATRVGRMGKLVTLGILALLVGALVWPAGWAFVFETGVAWLYLALAAVGVHLAARPLARAGFSTAGLLLASATVFMLVPALLLRNNSTLLLLATGFELTFAAHSYVAETGKGRTEVSLAQGLTFVLVNPTLVYAMRGKDLGVAACSRPALVRMVLATGALLAVPFVTFGVSAASTLLSVYTRYGTGWMQTVASWTVVLAFLLVQYLGHSSLASFQISAMRMLGYQVPERYNYPFLATSPDDFWRRWNTYLGAWLQRYVFFPVAMQAQRQLPRRAWTFGKGLALLAAFTVCGLAHEAAGYALRFTVPIGAGLAFAFYGLMVGLYIWTRTLLVRALGPARERSLVLRSAGVVISAVVSSSVLLAFGWVALPALAGQGLNARVLGWLVP